MVRKERRNKNSVKSMRAGRVERGNVGRNENRGNRSKN